MADSTPDILTLTAEIVSSYLSKSHVNASEIPTLIKNVRGALSEGSEPPVEEASTQAPTNMPSRAQIRKSITPDALISFLDGKPYKTLKRHLARHGMDLKEYRTAYGLPSDYPGTAPSYSAARSAMAKSLGLGARGRNAGKADDAAPEPVAANAEEKAIKAPHPRKAAE